MHISQMHEKISVIMPTYNCARYIEEAILSVQAQSYENWELFVVDDMSTDNTKQVVAPFLEDYRIHYHCLTEKGGPAAARNWGLQHASGEYVAFLDSDDLWSEQKLEKQISFMKNHAGQNCYFSCTGYEKMDITGKSLGVTILPPQKAGYWLVFWLGNPIGNSTVIYDRRYFGDVQIPLIQRRNDYALWLQLLRSDTVVFGMDDITMRYRVRKGSVSSNKWNGIRSIWHLYRNVEKRNPVISVCGVISWAFVKGTGIGLKIRKDLG